MGLEPRALRRATTGSTRLSGPITRAASTSVSTSAISAGCRRWLGSDSTRRARGTALRASATVGWLWASTATRAPGATSALTRAASASEARFHSAKVQLRSPKARAIVRGA
ncbi:MAG: hypothetical protein IPN02_19395 [Candidatus Microthrix sp.]|uniref:Uncharacterized protein n=1 Tax=Candidatus Neomicrothrix subdominans TaxID=2954438 RepID=A0A936TGB7_9ACTN|nr:hypothetical protein [Candidatus Microthrix subdominans]